MSGTTLALTSPGEAAGQNPGSGAALMKNPSNVRRAFRRVVAAVELDAGEWTPRELRHSFVSLFSDSCVPIERISVLLGHRGSHVTELVYRKQLRPLVQDGATVMDELFKRREA